MTYTRDSFQQLSETYSSIVEKKVKYYKGEDRDKETGIPKGVKTQTSTKQPKERKQTKPPYESLAASHELQGDVVEDAKMGKQSDEKLAALHKQFSSMDQTSPANSHMTKRVQREINKRKKQKPVSEAKVDAGKSPETKEKDRNVRKFGVSHNVAGHGKLRRSLHKMNRGDKKIPGDKSAWTEMESVQLGEEGYDRMRDKHLERGGIGAVGSKSPSRPYTRSEKQPKGKTVLQKETEKKYGKGATALGIVKKDIEDKHGKGAIMDTKKK